MADLGRSIILAFDVHSESNLTFEEDDLAQTLNLDNIERLNNHGLTDIKVWIYIVSTAIGFVKERLSDVQDYN
jgi:hypothetical protein